MSESRSERVTVHLCTSALLLSEICACTSCAADHVASYYSTITAMLVLLMLLAIVDIIVTSVSCCVWGKKTKNNVTVAPVTGVVVKGEVIETTATVV